MGWSYGGPTRSALQFDNLAREVAHVLPARQWRPLRGMFERVSRADGPFTVSPSDAKRFGEALRSAAGHPKVDAGWAAFALDIATAADAAANCGRPWRWS
jgi:hypothetical protein